MLPKRCFVIFLLFLYVLSADGNCFSLVERKYLWIEAESAEKILFPVEIVEDKDCSNEKCIIIRDGAGVGFRGAAGEAVYTIDIEEDGEYIVWGRVFWKNGCGNSVYFGIDDFHFNDTGRNVYDYVLGHQLIFNKWIWVKGNKYSLSKGRHTLKIKNREDGIKVDKLLLTNDYEAVPCGFNTLSFSISLPGKDFIKDGEYYKYKEFYSEIKYSTGSVNQRDLAFLFSYLDTNNYKEVHLFNDTLKIRSIENGKENIYYQAKLPELEEKEESTMALCYLNSQLSVVVNGKDVAFIESIPSTEGLVGVRINGEFLKVNNIKCIPIGPIYFGDNFYDSVWHFAENPLGWQEISGDWNAEMKEGFAYYNRSNKEKEAITVSGESWWRDYQYIACVKDEEKRGFGLVFYFKDEQNFYLFKFGVKDGKDKFILTKRVKGEGAILAEKDCLSLDFSRWHKITIKIFNGNIQTYVDNENVFNVKDESINNGKVGLCGNNYGAIAFDDVSVESIYSKDAFLNRRKDYSAVLYIDDLFDFYPKDLGSKKDRILDEASKYLFDKQLAPLPVNKNPLENWYVSAGEWEIEENRIHCKKTSGVSQLWCKWSVFKDMAIELDFTLANPAAGDLAIMLYQDEDGISNSVRISSNKIELLENFKPVGSTNIAFDMSANSKHHIALESAKDKLICYLDGKKVIEGALNKVPARIRPSFWSKSGDIYIDNVEIYSYPKKEYNFSVITNAIEDFIEWEEATPYWGISFADFNKGLKAVVKAEGKDEGSIIWNRDRYLSKDIALEIKSRFFERPETNETKVEKNKIGMIICSKGNINSGYRVLFSGDNVVLYKNGVEVSSSFLKNINMHKWQGFKIQKTDKIIRVYASDFFGNDRLALEYIDTEPIEGGRAGIQVIAAADSEAVFSPIYIY